MSIFCQCYKASCLLLTCSSWNVWYCMLRKCVCARTAAASAQAEHGIWIWHTGLLTWAAATCAGLFLCALLQNPLTFFAICQLSLCRAICRLTPYLAVCTQAWQQQQQQQYKTYGSPQQPQQQQMQVQVRATTELFWWH